MTASQARSAALREVETWERRTRMNLDGENDAGNFTGRPRPNMIRDTPLALFL